MGDITAIGLGLMGAALARAIHASGHDLTVWNRSPEKMRPFAEEGVPTAPDAASAIAASPNILLCINDYAKAEALLQSEQIRPMLPGRTVIQLSTGTPREAHEASDRMKTQDASYLDGAILCEPDAIGTENARILLSGNEVAFERAGSLLQCLGGEVRYLGSNVAAASALDLAWLMTRYGRFMAIIHAANLCKSEGADLRDFASLLPEDALSQHWIRVIQDESYHNCTATLRV